MMGYVHKEIPIPFITVQKYEGIHPAAKPLHLLFTLSQSLFQYNNIHSHVTMLSFKGKYHGKILWLTQYHGSAKMLANTHPKKISWGLRPRTPRQGD